MEQSRGIDGNNIATVLMKERNIDLQAASDIIGKHFKILMDSYLEARKHLPSWDPETDGNVARYMEATAHWVKGNLEYVQSQNALGDANHFMIAGALKHSATLEVAFWKSRRPLSCTLLREVYHRN